MIAKKRLIRIEASLTPKQVVLFWLRQDFRDKTSDEYAKWLIQHPLSAYPRPRAAKQVTDAIRAAMKGQEPGRVNKAVRQVQMQADFLILLVLRANHAILDDAQVRHLQIALLYEQLRNAALGKKSATPWIDHLREFATELFSLQDASNIIREQYFDGETILLRDAREALEQQTKIVQRWVDVCDQVVIETGQPELIADHESFRKSLHERGLETADYIVALAKSKMLDDFGEHSAADAAIKPYFLERLRESRVSAGTT